MDMFHLIGSLNFYAVLLGVFAVAFMLSLWRAAIDPKIDFNLIDLITESDVNTGRKKASMPKILQLVGGVTGTFIVVKLTLQNNINFEMFGVYLTYVASVDGFSRFMLAKYGVKLPMAMEPNLNLIKNSTN